MSRLPFLLLYCEPLLLLLPLRFVVLVLPRVQFLLLLLWRENFEVHLRPVVVVVAVAAATVFDVAEQRRLTREQGAALGAPFLSLPRMFQIDVNDGTVDVRLGRGMGIVSTMVLVQGEAIDGRRWPLQRQGRGLLSATQTRRRLSPDAGLS